jgi:hypothetical protein
LQQCQDLQKQQQQHLLGHQLMLTKACLLALLDFSQHLLLTH